MAMVEEVYEGFNLYDEDYKLGIDIVRDIEQRYNFFDVNISKKTRIFPHENLMLLKFQLFLRMSIWRLSKSCLKARIIK